MKSKASESLFYCFVRTCRNGWFQSVESDLDVGVVVEVSLDVWIFERLIWMLT